MFERTGSNKQVLYLISWGTIISKAFYLKSSLTAAAIIFDFYLSVKEVESLKIGNDANETYHVER